MNWSCRIPANVSLVTRDTKLFCNNLHLNKYTSINHCQLNWWFSWPFYQPLFQTWKLQTNTLYPLFVINSTPFSPLSLSPLWITQTHRISMSPWSRKVSSSISDILLELKSLYIHNHRRHTVHLLWSLLFSHDPRGIARGSKYTAMHFSSNSTSDSRVWKHQHIIDSIDPYFRLSFWKLLPTHSLFPLRMTPQVLDTFATPHIDYRGPPSPRQPKCVS